MEHNQFKPVVTALGGLDAAAVAIHATLVAFSALSWEAMAALLKTALAVPASLLPKLRAFVDALIDYLTLMGNDIPSAASQEFLTVTKGFARKVMAGDATARDAAEGARRLAAYTHVLEEMETKGLRKIMAAGRRLARVGG